ncbi:MAG: hypothetical protein ACE5EE_02230 [Fidelibacterota bacterium]
MDWVSVLNLIHIVSGVFWGGGVFLMAWFIVPAVQATGNDGQIFMKGMMQGTRISLYLNVSAWLAVLSGTYLSWVYSGGFGRDWLMSGMGMSITVGGILSGIALTIGMAFQVPSAKRVALLGKEIESQSRPPTPEQLTEIQQLQNKMMASVRWIAILLLITVIAMALGRRLFWY